MTTFVNIRRKATLSWVAVLACGCLGWTTSCHTRRLSLSTPVQPGTAVVGGPAKPKTSNAQYLTTIADYIEQYGALAAHEQRQYGVPASIILAQGIHESRAGMSDLASKANNHFGVKCTSDWTGPGFYVDDDKPGECFRKYSSAEESFRDHIAFLHRKRYASLFTLDANNYQAWAYGLKACGYATNPNYPQILIGIIEKYNLSRFDGNGKDISSPSLTSTPSPQRPTIDPPHNATLPARNRPQAEVVMVYDTLTHQVVPAGNGDVRYGQNSATGPIVPNPDSGLALGVGAKVSPVQTNGPARVRGRAGEKATPAGSSLGDGTPPPAGKPPGDGTLSPAGSTTGEDSIPSTYTVRQGDTLYSISKRFHSSVEELRVYNDLPDHSIKIDQVIKLKKL